MLRCDACNCWSADGKRWLAFLAQDEHDEWPLPVVFCPPCAQRECERAAPGADAYR
ncbi:MAG TPA: hypothetical protein VK874_12440 [Gaiellaceae bacterium]|nr:hypothetical protein [Gaiellaceae bacterium]